VHAFRDVATAAYCPRKLYYRQRDGPPDVPDRVGRVRELAFAYDDLLAADGNDPDPPPWGAVDLPVALDVIRDRLAAARDRLDCWERLVAPAARDVSLEGKDCRGVAHKVLPDPPIPALVFAGRPPESGVWEPQSVRLVAAALALAHERQSPVASAVAEYPAQGVVRRVDLSARRRDAYRRALRAARSVDAPPPRLRDDAKCEPCEYRTDCGVRSRSLLSRLRGD
jgi:CRISPR-associated exonuclease Cas4